ncbi:hypothetical protein C8Q79DRAFT_1013353 [Trametes meyenii]|nr:hypothetical protein C8Q79DRAFT_1013353 [Trametes meyenii]
MSADPLLLAQMPSIIIINKSPSAVSAFVSKYSNSNGDDSWFNLAQGARDSWNRAGWELVAFKNANDTKRAGVYVPSNAVVTFNGFDNITVESLNVHSSRKYPEKRYRIAMSSIIVINKSSSAVSVFVSKYSNSSGDDSWFTVAAGGRDSWGRKGWELVAFKNASDTDRAGVYVPANSVVTFNDLAHISVL